jgi:transposase
MGVDSVRADTLRTGERAMGQPIEITRTDLTAAELRAAAGKIGDGAVVRRLLAIALLLEGHSRTAAAEMNAMTRQTLRDWVHRYNDEGMAGLRSHTGPGRAPVLTDAQMAELKEIVIKGPDTERHTVMRWRCFDLRAEIAARWSVTVCEQTVGRWLRQLRLTRLQPRPFHPKKDPEAEVAFKKNSPAW